MVNVQSQGMSDLINCPIRVSPKTRMNLSPIIFDKKRIITITNLAESFSMPLDEAQNILNTFWRDNSDKLKVIFWISSKLGIQLSNTGENVYATYSSLDNEPIDLSLIADANYTSLDSENTDGDLERVYVDRKFVKHVATKIAKKSPVKITSLPVKRKLEPKKEIKTTQKSIGSYFKKSSTQKTEPESFFKRSKK